MSSNTGAKAPTSIRIFRKFITVSNSKSGVQVLNAEGVVSKECYDLWLETRRTLPSCPQKSFQRALSSHVCGVDGRHPFEPDEESAILQVIRRKQKWPCFENEQIKFGLNGFRAKGFHEKATTPTTTKLKTEWKGKKEKRSTAKDELRLRKKVKKVKREEDEEEETTLESGNSLSIGEDVEEDEEDYNEQEEEENVDDDGLRAQSPLIYHDEHAELLYEQDDTFKGFGYKAMVLIKQFRKFGGDSWESILKLIRYTLLSLGYFEEADIELVRKKYEEICARYPNQGVLVIDPLSREFKNRIPFCNLKAEERFGKITPADGGTNRAFIPHYENYKLLKYVASMWYSPGNEFQNEYDLIHHDGSIRRVRSWCTYDPDLRVCFARGYLDVN